MIEVYTNLFVGTEQNCSFHPPEEWAIIHACKYPCHANALNYTKSLPKNHPHYLIAEKDRHLFLNMVDMEQELSPVYTNPIMQAAMAFIEKNIATNKVLVHCNQGISRSPSIAILYLARIKAIPNDSFDNAAKEFVKKYPAYTPGRGISLYMQRNWNILME